jgi:hypothetical protein
MAVGGKSGDWQTQAKATVTSIQSILCLTKRLR